MELVSKIVWGASGECIEALSKAPVTKCTLETIVYPVPQHQYLAASRLCYIPHFLLWPQGCSATPLGLPFSWPSEGVKDQWPLGRQLLTHNSNESFHQRHSPKSSAGVWGASIPSALKLFSFLFIICSASLLFSSFWVPPSAAESLLS